MTEPKEDVKGYIFVKKKFMITMITIALVCLITAAVAMQWAVYIDTKSNQRWCGVVELFNEGYKEVPPDSERTRKFATEFLKLSTDFKCK